MPGQRKKPSCCPHVIDCHRSLSWNYILSKRESLCHTCSHLADDVWLCTTCLACHGNHSDTDTDHSFEHVKRHNHPLAVNPKSGRFWCHNCEVEVFQGGDNSPEFRIPKQLMMPVDWDSLTGTDMFGGHNCLKGLTGLRNLGNTCYMNSAIQCLSNCSAMTSYFLTLVDSDIPDPRRARLTAAYTRLIRELWSADPAPVSAPLEFLRAIQNVNSTFKGYMQQDTQELLRSLIDQLHEELKRELTYDPPCHITTNPDHPEHCSILYSSIIANIFNGLIKSSVRCLHCEKVSVTKETFQDLSLPIPCGDQLTQLHNKSRGVAQPVSQSVDMNKGYISWLFSSLYYIWSMANRWNWLSYETVTLEDCLSAFFSVDDLKGDNMYSCENCKILRNGMKQVSIFSLPEVLCIHLKRFRHDLLHSSKITTHVTFPLEGLDISPYMEKDAGERLKGCYNLSGVICHLGSFAGGHYKAYARHPGNRGWYEYDDQYVCEVSPQTVRNCEAYVLFYTRDASTQLTFRNQLSARLQVEKEDNLLQFYISKIWLFKLFSLADPGPISNDSDFLCVHGAVRPSEFSMIYERVVGISADNWQWLYSRYGGGPVITSLTKCSTCQANIDKNKARQDQERTTYVRLRNRPMNNAYAINTSWLSRWENYVTGRINIPPGPIDNKSIAAQKAGDTRRNRLPSYCQVNGPTWRYLKKTYGGGPEAIISRGRGVESDDDDLFTTSQTTVPPEEEMESASMHVTTSKSEAILSPQATTTSKSPSKSRSAPHIAPPEYSADALKNNASS